MGLKIYNTLARQEEEFKPLSQSHVKMYVCGPTVYDMLHVGNYRGVIFFNLVRRWLEHLGHKVTYVYNYTDVDDKIIKRANEEGKRPDEISAQYIKEYEKDFDALKLTKHEHNPRATEYIDKMVEAIKVLVDKGHAYVIDGEVFFAIGSFKGYGKLSHKKLEELQVGHRVDPDPRKKDPLDFVLWKPSKDGEPSWDSPWGRGRPGWHIECSVMVKTLLGESIDIHGGGIDLIFPHLENEIAQSEAVTGKPFVRTWMHNNFINFGEAKMSKSLGNVVSGRAFLENYHPEILKFLILSVHYRSPLSLADTQIQQAIAALARIYAALSVCEDMLNADNVGALREAPLPNADFKKTLEEADGAFAQAMNSDFNTPAAFAKIFDVVRSFNALLPKAGKPSETLKAQSAVLREFIVSNGELMSLFQEPPAAFLKTLDRILIKEKGLDEGMIEQRIRERIKAREKKDFKTSDAIRDELNGLGIDIKDGIEGTSWEVKKG